MLLTVSESELLLFAGQLAKAIEPGAKIYLEGALGAGKTTFVRGLLLGLGYEGIVNSPTFTLVESYELANFTLHHFDCYRMERVEELWEIGLSEYFSRESICVVEWASNFESELPSPDVKIYIEFCHEGRQLQLVKCSAMGERILQKCHDNRT